MAAPTAIPVTAFSDCGVSIIRYGYLSLSPAVVPSAPFLYETSSPITTTSLSTSIIWSVASLIASVYVIILLDIEVGV